MANTYLHVVAAIIWQSSQQQSFLISQRQKGKHLQGYWELPGGKMETGETPRQALQRELNEEVNITVIESKPFMQVEHQYSDRNILLDVWVVNAFKGKVKACEGQSIRWVNIDDLDDYEFPAADLPILAAIKNNVTT